mmetsp:Transcript_3772/g.6444  ORF Transcript_3772/g.6444 Transcript_3772/m.6444 type:complete len:268 (+) Transcript_3772:732-1535(+)
MMLGNLFQCLPHALVVCLELLNGLLNGSYKAFLAVTSHFSVHAVSFTPKCLKLVLSKLFLNTILVTINPTLPVDVCLASSYESDAAINVKFERLRRLLHRFFRDESLSLASHKQSNFGTFGRADIEQGIRHCLLLTAAGEPDEDGCDAAFFKALLEEAALVFEPLDFGLQRLELCLLSQSCPTSVFPVSLPAPGQSLLCIFFFFLHVGVFGSIERRNGVQQNGYVGVIAGFLVQIIFCRNYVISFHAARPGRTQHLLGWLCTTSMKE